MNTALKNLSVWVTVLGVFVGAYIYLVSVIPGREATIATVLCFSFTICYLLMARSYINGIQKGTHEVNQKLVDYIEKSEMKFEADKQEWEARREIRNRALPYLIDRTQNMNGTGPRENSNANTH